MQIREAKVFHFGKLQDRTYRFSPGINVVYGENEAGKSTLHAFLFAMLFGMEKGKGRAAAGDTYTQYEPWHAPADYSGALRFEVDGRPFYLERNFYHREKSEYLRNEADGEELSVAYGDLAVLLGGISKESFGNTYDIPQTGAVTGKELSDLLSEYLSDAEGSGDGSVHVARALVALQNKKKELNADLRKYTDEKEKQCAGWCVEKNLLEQDAVKLRRETQEAEQVLREMEAQRISDEDAAHRRLLGKRKGAFAVAAVCLAAFFGNGWMHAVFSYPKQIFLPVQLLLAIAAAAGTVTGAYLTAGKRSKRHMCAENQSAGVSVQAQKQTEQMLARLSETLADKEIRLSNLEEMLEDAKKPDAVQRELRENIEAIELAATEIEKLAGELRMELADEINGEISGWVSHFTAQKYDLVHMGENGKLCVWADGKEVPPEALSRGTLEQISLAFRIAVGKIASRNEQMPIFLDEAFAMYDDRRLRETLKALSGMEEQIFIFTSGRREMQQLDELGVTYHKVML